MIHKAPLVDAGDFEHPVAKDPLIGQVVDGIDGHDIGKKGIVLKDSIQPVRHDGSVPVMTVDHIRLPVQKLEGFEYRPTIEDESIGIVGVHVDTFPVKVSGIVHHVDRNVGIDGPLQDASWLGGVMDRYVKGRHHLMELELVRIDTTVAWHGHSDIVSQGTQSLGQYPGYVSKAASFGKRYDLGR